MMEIENLLKVIKKQSLELERRGKIMADLEEQIRSLKENTLIISIQNKQLEAMLETSKQERLKFLEDNEELEKELEKTKAELALAL